MSAEDVLRTVLRARGARRRTYEAILGRMLLVAEDAGRDEEPLLHLEEFLGLGWQLGCDVPPPHADCEERLRALGLVVRPYVDPEPEPLPDEIERLTRST